MIGLNWNFVEFTNLIYSTCKYHKELNTYKHLKDKHSMSPREFRQADLNVQMKKNMLQKNEELKSIIKKANEYN